MWIADDWGYLRLDSEGDRPFVDDLGFIRLDAMAGKTNCTPGRTIPCGNRCRTPANCVKAKKETSQGRVQRLGKENLAEFANARRKAKGMGDRETVNLVRDLEKEVLSDKPIPTKQTKAVKPTIKRSPKPAQKPTKPDPFEDDLFGDVEEPSPTPKKAAVAKNQSGEYTPSPVFAAMTAEVQERPGESFMQAHKRTKEEQKAVLDSMRAQSKTPPMDLPKDPKVWKEMRSTDEERQNFMNNFAASAPVRKDWGLSPKRLRESQAQAGNPPFPEEVLALKLYTSEDFLSMNAALREMDDKDYEPRVSDSFKEGRSVDQVRAESIRNARVATAALNALPDYEGTVFRGMRSSALIPMDQIKSQYKPGATVTEKGFTSTSSDTSASFGDRDGVDVQFVINSKTGKSVEQYSEAKHEKEVLFRPYTQFKVLKQEQVGGKTVIYMDEV